MRNNLGHNRPIGGAIGFNNDRLLCAPFQGYIDFIGNGARLEANGPAGRRVELVNCILELVIVADRDYRQLNRAHPLVPSLIVIHFEAAPTDLVGTQKPHVTWLTNSFKCLSDLFMPFAEIRASRIECMRYLAAIAKKNFAEHSFAKGEINWQTASLGLTTRREICETQLNNPISMAIVSVCVTTKLRLHFAGKCGGPSRLVGSRQEDRRAGGQSCGNEHGSSGKRVVSGDRRNVAGKG